MRHTLPPGWEEKTLGEVCDIYIGKTPARSNISYWDKNKETNNIWLSIADLLNTTNKQVFSSKEFLSNKGASLVPIVEPGTLLLSFKLTIGRVAFAGVPLRTNEAIAQLPIQDSQILDKNYLYYYLQYYDYEQLLRGDVKVKGKTLNKEKLKNLTVQYPSLPEQKRIVEKLDKIFAAIDKAKSQTEKNLQNAKALFNIYLNSLSYSTKKLGELVRITTGKLNANAQEKNGKYPFFTCSREILYINTYAFDCEAILLAGNNASADFNVKYYKGKFNAYQRTYVITIQDTYKLSYKYLYFQLIKELSQLKKIAVGANTRFLRLGMIKDINLALPPLEKQQQIVSCLDSLYAKTQELEKIYIQKLADLEELKQSVLQQAFSGKL